MKFATIVCLLGATEAAKKYWSPEAVDEAMHILGEMKETFVAGHEMRAKEMRNFKREMNAYWEPRLPKYVPEAMEWFNSEAVQAAKYNKENVVMPSAEHQKIIQDVMKVGDGFENRWDWHKGMNADGSYEEYMANADIREMFEELYQIKEDFKAFIESDIVKRQGELDLAAFQNPHFGNLVGYMADDLDIHSCEELKKKLCCMMKELRRRHAECPLAQKMKKLIVRLLMHIKETEQVTDTGADEDWENWWNAHDFQPWM